MLSTTFRLIPSQRPSHSDLIIVDGSNIEIRVFNLTTEVYKADPAAIRFYGDDHGDPLVFETTNCSAEDSEMIIAALKWYARYLDYPQMEITLVNPLPEVRLRIVS